MTATVTTFKSPKPAEAHGAHEYYDDLPSKHWRIVSSWQSL
jgi:hypothetical protein